jgi:hypothetical protein
MTYLPTYLPTNLLTYLITYLLLPIYHPTYLPLTYLHRPLMDYTLPTYLPPLPTNHRAIYLLIIFLTYLYN